MLSLFSFFSFSLFCIIHCYVQISEPDIGDWLVWSSIFATYSPTEMTLPIVRLQRQSPKSSHDFHQFRPILQPRVCLHLLIFQDPKVTLSFFRRSESSNYKKTDEWKLCSEWLNVMITSRLPLHSLFFLNISMPHYSSE